MDIKSAFTKKISIALLFAVCVFFISGCSVTNQVKRQYDKIQGSPEVLSISPAGGARDIALDSRVEIAFTTEMDESTLNAKGVIISYTKEDLVVFLNPFLNSSYEYDASAKKLVVTPAQKFIPGQEIRVVLTDFVRSLDQAQLPTGTDTMGDERYVYTFNTVALAGEQDNIGESQVEKAVTSSEEVKNSSFDALAAESIVKDFMISRSETYKFDGRTDTLSIEKIVPVGCAGCFDVIASFISKNTGYGDRSSEGLSSSETFHEALFTIENGEIKKATLDETWNMIDQALL